MVKKMMIRFNMEDEQHRLAYEILVGRNRCRYKALADYVVPSVIEYAKNAKEQKSLLLSEQDKEQMVKEILRELERKNQLSHEPGI